MGFLDLFKQDETLALPDNFNNSIIYPVSNNYYTVNIGQNISINEGWNAVIVVKGKPQDILPAGNHQLSIFNLPNTTRMLKLNQGKVKKNAQTVNVELPQTFKCDLYFINLNQISNFPWHSGRVPIKSKLYGRYKVGLKGILQLKIFDSIKFLKLLLLERGHIKKGQGEKVLSGLINEEVYNSILFSSFYGPRQFADTKNINEFLLNKLNENFKPYGLQIEELSTQDVKFYGKVNQQLTREDEAFKSGFVNDLNTDDILNDGKITLDANAEAEAPKNYYHQDDVEQQNNFNEYEDAETQPERQVMQSVKIKERYNNMQDIQNEINDTLGTSTSRIEVTDEKPVKIKLNKKDK